ncbi:MAG: pantetheine-phosphate adenylyltransferase [Clostridia bacterium]|nr:pantetheine-phosphate adenylyltransferase [Clostridia bacterium]
MVHAIYPGSFDPVTNGHLDIIRRAAKMFDCLTVVVAQNASKPSGCFTPTERAELLKRSTADIPNVSVDICTGLLADYARDNGIAVIIKGLRAVSDFEHEFQQALTNKKLNPELETFFISAEADYMFLSSSVVKQICLFGGDISEFVPSAVKEDIIRRIQNKD